jgi:hypothetical protein
LQALGIILFLVYALLLGWLLYRNPFFRKLSIPPWFTLALFAAKLLAGAAYGYLLSQWHHHEVRADTWRYFLLSLEEKEWLLRDPARFFADLFLPRYTHDSGITGTQGSLLNDLKEMLVIKLMAICNLLTGSRYYVNLIFFNYLTLFGQVALAALWAKAFRLSRARWLVAFSLLWPSVLFWSSGFHRDGLILHCIGWICWLTWRIWKKENISCGLALFIAQLPGIDIDSGDRDGLDLLQTLCTTQVVVACYWDGFNSGSFSYWQGKSATAVAPPAGSAAKGI